MNQEHNILRNAFGKFARIKLDRRALVFLFFLVISTIYWFLNAMGREYTARLNYPVRYINYPDKMVMVGELPSDLELTVNAHGYTLLKYYISRRLMPIVFDVNSFSLNKLPDTETSNFYLLSSVANTRIAGQLGADIEILGIRPDTLFFSFTDMVNRKLPVNPVLDLAFEPQFMIKGNIRVEPDSVTVSGPASIIDTMQFVHTVPLRMRGLNESVLKTVNISSLDMLGFSERRVLVDIPVEQFTEASVKVVIETVNIPNSMIMKTFPAEITVSYLVALTDYDKVSPQQFVAMVDYKSISSGPGRLAVNIIKQPEFIKAVRYTPLVVDYIIER